MPSFLVFLTKAFSTVLLGTGGETGLSLGVGGKAAEEPIDASSWAFSDLMYAF